MSIPGNPQAINALLKKVSADLDACRAQLRECERAFQRSNYQSAHEEFEEFDAEKDALKYRLRQCYLSLILLMEAAQVNLYQARFLEDWVRFKDVLDEVGHLKEDPEWLYSEPLIYLTEVIESLQAAIGSAAAHAPGLQLLERVLRQTPYILSDRGVVPSSEKELRIPVFDLVKTIFPDTKREVPIPQISKSYKADFGVPSLKAAVEFKFAETETELKSEIDGVFADMKGYAGVSDWVRFYAVFFTAAPIMAPERLEQMWTHVGADHSWTPIIVHGPGKRATRQKAPPGE